MINLILCHWSIRGIWIAKIENHFLQFQEIVSYVLFLEWNIEKMFLVVCVIPVKNERESTYFTLYVKHFENPMNTTPKSIEIVVCIIENPLKRVSSSYFDAVKCTFKCCFLCFSNYFISFILSFRYFIFVRSYSTLQWNECVMCINISISSTTVTY